MNIDIEKLDALTQELKTTLKEGLLSTDIFDRTTGLSLASFNPQPTAAALFTEVTNVITSTLADSGLPNLKRYRNRRRLSVAACANFRHDYTDD
jgi:hypothetical protein